MELIATPVAGDQSMMIQPDQTLSVLQGVANGVELNWTQSNGDWISGSGYIEENDPDLLGYIPVGVVRDFFIYARVELDSVGPGDGGNCCFWFQNNSTGEFYYFCLNGNSGGDAYIYSVSSGGSWGSTVYDRLDSYVAADTPFYVYFVRTNDVLQFYVSGTASIGALRSGFGATTVAIPGVLCGIHNLKIYDAIIFY